MKLNNILFIACLFFSLAACKSDKPATTDAATVTEEPGHEGHNHAPGEHNSPNNNDSEPLKPLPNPCELVSTEWLLKNTNFKVNEPRIKEGSPGASTDSRSCFMQWNQNGDPNAGFLINIMTNPLPDEISSYPTTYINAKRNDGETVMGSDTAVPYSKIEGLGVDAVGCYKLGKYYWRIDNNYLFMIAYNIDMPEKEQKETSIKMGNEILKNFKRLQQ